MKIKLGKRKTTDHGVHSSQTAKVQASDPTWGRERTPWGWRRGGDRGMVPGNGARTVLTQTGETSHYVGQVRSGGC